MKKLKRYTKLVAFRISDKMKQQMDELSRNFNLTEGEFIRDAILKSIRHFKRLEKRNTEVLS